MIGHVLEFLVLRILARLFPERFRLLPRVPDGVPLLRQFKLCSFGQEEPRGRPGKYYFGVYLQSFVNAEKADRYHIHRWRYMFSFVLSGLFVEERPGHKLVRHKAPSAYSMNDKVIHRLTWVAPRTWTLFIMFGRNRVNLTGGWGYFLRPGMRYTPWNAAIPKNRRVGAL